MESGFYVEEKVMNCPLCKAAMINSRTNMPFEMENDRLVVIKNVPALVCRQCGEFFIEITIARVLENLVSTAVKDGVTLGFLEYSEAA